MWNALLAVKWLIEDLDDFLRLALSDYLNLIESIYRRNELRKEIVERSRTYSYRRNYVMNAGNVIISFGAFWNVVAVGVISSFVCVDKPNTKLNMQHFNSSHVFRSYLLLRTRWHKRQKQKAYEKL